MSARFFVGIFAAVAVIGGLVLAHRSGLLQMPAQGTGRPPNVILISIDTLRSDHLSAYGHPIPTSPTIDTLARDGVTFTRAYSTTSWTVPALVSMLTSTLPIHHGVIHGVIRAGELYGQETVPPDLPNIPEMLRARGYRTLGVAANTHLEADAGFARGFDRYDCPGFVSAAEVLDVVRTWPAEITRDQPYFAWVHFLDPHEPYDPHEPFLTEFLGGRPRYPELDSLPARTYEVNGLSDTQLDYVKTLYDSEIRYSDEHVAEALRILGVTDDDLVIFTSDHGEEFGEHGLFQHGRSLNEASVRIPLIVRFPHREFAGRTSSTPVTIMDIFPTIANVVGSVPPAGLEGTALSTDPRSRSAEATPILLELSRRENRFRALVVDPWKLVVDLTEKRPQQLFNVRDDAAERVDVATRETAEVDRLQKMLADYTDKQKRRPPPRTQQVLTPKQVDQLKAMGYLQ